ncbi:MAG: iron ABC transporter permease [Marinifilaceae bacterium]|nr:iron ABC transporter permease [Marinifilaceae bacterium]
MTNNVVIRYLSMQRRNRVIILIILLLALIAAIVSAVAGLKTIFANQYIVKEAILSIRITRVISALLCGVLLSVSGVIMQTLLKNPLASPYTLGISNAAAFGAALSILFFGGISIPGVTFVSAFVVSLVGLAIILLISSLKGGGVESVIMAGVVINSLFSSGIALLQYIADSAQLASILFWTFGDLGRGEWNTLFALLAVTVVATLFFYSKRWDYKALEVSDEYARSVGVAPIRCRLTALVIASLITAFTVSIFGVIAFVGLAVPHIMRRVVGGNLNYLLPSSMFFGALFMVICDMVSRYLLSPLLLPIGIITSLVGVPVFLIILCNFYRR